MKYDCPMMTVTMLQQLLSNAMNLWLCQLRQSCIQTQLWIALPNYFGISNSMTNEEYMQQVIKEWERIDDDPDLFDELNFFELMEDDE